jgi:ferredoxin-NAD(P)+ reductase (naphthalene dioxygenase ferredoxin-specific)
VPQIKLQQWPAAFRCTRGSILDAALAAGVPYPHSCRSGECGTCKSRLIAGTVSMDGCAPEALSNAERAGGLILACRARPRSDVEVAWTQQDGSEQCVLPRRLHATVINMEPATHDITRLRLELQGTAFRFAAGQYVRLTFAGCPSRSYSMANRPDDPILEFHVRHVPGGAVSSHVAHKLRRGECVELDGPYGTACLREPASNPLLLVAGGSGLAPIKSILLAALAHDVDRAIYLYHGVREARDLYDGEALARAATGRTVTCTPVLSTQLQHDACRLGFVHDAIAADFGSLSGFDVYVAGPPPMVDAVTRTAVALGAKEEDVRADAFYTARDTSKRARNPLKAVASLLRLSKAA